MDGRFVPGRGARRGRVEGSWELPGCKADGVVTQKGPGKEVGRGWTRGDGSRDGKVRVYRRLRGVECRHGDPLYLDMASARGGTLRGARRSRRVVR